MRQSGYWELAGSAAVVALLLSLVPPALTQPAEPALHVGGSNSYPPFHYPLADAGGAAGFDVAVLREIARRAGMRADFRFGDWGQIQQQLADGELDVVPMFVSDERQRRFLFTDAVSVEHHQAFGIGETLVLRRLEDIAGLRVATETASLAGAMLRELAVPADIVETSSETAALQAVVDGKADVALVPVRVALHAMATGEVQQLNAFSPPLLPVTYSFAIAPGRQDLVDIMNGQLAAMQRDGSLLALQAEWLAPAQRSRPEEWHWQLLIAGLASTMLAVYQASRRRRWLAAAPAAGAVPAATDPDQESLLQDLRVVLRDGGLDWLFQPQVSVSGKCVTGAEMLVRWHHAERGFVAPDRFITLAEREGLIRDLTRHAIARAHEVLRHWKSEALDWSLSINVSANDLADADTLTHLIESMRGFEHRVILEITETALMRDMQRILHAVDLLRSARIRLSLDDYGTGYSSMAYLKEFSFDEIKIDGTFTRDLLRDQRNLMLTRASTQLGHELGAQVVAEGVEELESARKLAELGCDILQGYLFSRPLPLAAFNEFARNASIDLSLPPLPPQPGRRRNLPGPWRG